MFSQLKQELYPMTIREISKLEDTKFDVPICDMNKSGIYIISFENNIYVGSTINFSKRYDCHRLGHSKDGLSVDTEYLIKNGGVFKALFILDIYDISLLRECENIVIDYFKNDNNFNCYNTRVTGGFKEYKTIKIPASKYSDALSILIENGII